MAADKFLKANRILPTTMCTEDGDYISVKEVMEDYVESETKALIEKHKAELEYAKTEGYNLGSQHGQQQGT